MPGVGSEWCRSEWLDGGAAVVWTALLGNVPKNLPKTHEKDALKREYRYGRYHRFYLLRNEV
ncbi:hypothetical protein HMPREF1861_01884 [Corynebacterium kroppenstedtii]|nr:hypothetical protein HMPREF1861_01884 [Corynebacterium kroppenstedtii]